MTTFERSTLTNDFGLSVDIGTSQVTVHLVDIEAADILAESIIDNPQQAIGLDLITRIQYSSKSSTIEIQHRNFDKK